ncbi:MAG: SHOCT domain-containing protein [Pseudomonadota bacterium]
MSLADELEKLDTMRQTGVISDKDFVRAKEKLLQAGETLPKTAEKAAQPGLGTAMLKGLTFGLASGISNALSFVLVGAAAIAGIGAVAFVSESFAMMLAFGVVAIIIALVAAFFHGGFDLFG